MSKQPHPPSEPGPHGPAERRPADKTLRQCFLTRERLPKELLVRFVIGPEGQIVPDLAEKLPGRGLWLKSDRKTLDKAIEKRQFLKAAKEKVSVAKDLSDQVEALLAKRCVDLLGQAHGAGLVVLGGANVGALLRERGALALIEAEDGQPDGRRKMLGALKAGLLTWAAETEEEGPLVVGCFSAAQLSLALGRENVIHAALREGGLSARLLAELRRLGGFRPLRPKSWAVFRGAKAPPNKALSF